MAKSDRGFASMNKEKLKGISRKGGKASHGRGLKGFWSRLKSKFQS
ncbi:MAG: KGG domain-containing protein [Bacteriovoracaceae bacterium]